MKILHKVLNKKLLIEDIYLCRLKVNPPIKINNKQILNKITIIFNNNSKIIHHKDKHNINNKVNIYSKLSHTNILNKDKEYLRKY